MGLYVLWLWLLIKFSVNRYVFILVIYIYISLVNLLKYSVCKNCGCNIKYSGRGRPRIYCDDCSVIMIDNRRLYMLNYMQKYRKRIRKLFYE